MINNDILRRISTIFELTDEQICTIFALSEREVNTEQLASYFKEKDDADYQAIADVELADFLNGFIIEKRGPSDGAARPAEEQLTNNMIFNKVKIALSLKADEVISIMELADLSLGKYELSAFFRKVNNKHYRDCSDEVLSAFLKGLKIKSQ
jgi:uncharacterized protein YehS (DUF1456 family)